MYNQEIKLYSMLYVHDNNKKNINLKKDSEKSLDVYINCGRLIAKSLKDSCVSYAIITNEVDLISARVEALGGGVEVLNGDFYRKVPADVNFYSAHYKLDVIKSFGEGNFGENIGLIDLDMVVLNSDKLEESLCNVESGLLVYDITEQVEPSVGRLTIIESLEKLGCIIDNKLNWYGGEFIYGNKELFSRLSKKIEKYWEKYKNCYRELHHVGDEMVVTAALIDLKQEKVKLIDIGKSSEIATKPLIARWWSSRTLGRQTTLSEATSASILHLPSDKQFLSNMSNQDFDVGKFNRKYKNYMIVKIIPRHINNVIDKILKKKKMYVAKII